MYDDRYLTTDTATVTLDDDQSGVTVDDGDVEIDWESVEQTTIENAPHAQAFDTRDFYRLRTTVARPIPQPYRVNDEVVWLQKPREELKKAAWSLDNSPWTMDHPDTGLVQNTDDVRGYWDDTQYFEATDDLDSYLHIPVADDEAQTYIEQHPDVSVGFVNRVSDVGSYDGDVGNEPDVEIDGYQTDMLFDHCASVSSGRCSAAGGCGLAADAQQHGHMSTYDNDTVITYMSEDTESVTVDQSEHTHEGSWYAVPPDDNPDDAWKYPIDNCEDATDAWNLRGQGDISISVDTLEERIKRRANDLGCELPSTAQDASEYTIMSDECGCNDGGLSIEFDDLDPEVALDKVASRNDGIDEYLDGLKQKAQVADDAAEELDVNVEKLGDTVGMLDEQNEKLSERVDELEQPKREEHAQFIADSDTDRFGNSVEEVIENHDGLDDLAETRELVEDLSGGTSTKTANETTDDEGESSVELDRRGYVKFE